MYEALNAQLLEKLTQFSACVAEVVTRLLCVFLDLQETWHQNVRDILSREITPSSGLSIISAHGQVLAAVCQQLLALEIVPVTPLASFGKHQ